VVNGGYSMQTTCRSWTFNPGCDRPAQLVSRPESIVAETWGLYTHNYSGERVYNNMEDTPTGYLRFCCGWLTNGTGTGGGLNPYIAPKAFRAKALSNTLITLLTDTHLQPETNKPNYGKYFTTDAHTSSAYGNELVIVGGCEYPYGSFPITLPTISGGTVDKYVLTGWTLSVSVLPGNPTTDTDEFCSSPGRVTVYVARPASYPGVTQQTFVAPRVGGVLPFGAAHAIVRFGYVQPMTPDDPTYPCDTSCVIPIDHHNLDAYFRWEYLNSNNLPVSDPNPPASALLSQGLP
jgi:hypothetical protein